jgi:hypothetical protein
LATALGSLFLFSGLNQPPLERGSWPPVIAPVLYIFCTSFFARWRKNDVQKKEKERSAEG